MKLTLSLLLVATTAGAAPLAEAPSFTGDAMALRFPAECILRAVAAQKGISLKAEVPAPRIFLASQTSARQFDDAVEPQWKMRPGKIVNAYIAHRNEIYLLDDAAYYRSRGRFLDDSLAHEFVHYLQFQYQKASMEDESLEGEAIDAQTIFREKYLGTGKSPCEK